MIRLAPLEWQHWKKYRRWINDDEIARLVDRYLPVTESEHKSFYDSLLSDRSRIFFSVQKAPRDRFVGVCAFKKIDSKNRKAEFYICLNGKGVRGKGMGQKVVRKALDYAFGTLNLNRVYLYTPEYNKAAIQCYKKSGFKEEGRLREDIYSDGRYYDAVQMGYLKRFRSPHPKKRKRR